MKYSKEERLEIGRKIYNKEISKYEASEIYNIGVDTARNYLRMYRDNIGKYLDNYEVNNEELEKMSRRQLIEEIKRLRRNENGN